MVFRSITILDNLEAVCFQIVDDVDCVGADGVLHVVLGEPVLDVCDGVEGDPGAMSDIWTCREWGKPFGADMVSLPDVEGALPCNAMQWNASLCTVEHTAHHINVRRGVCRTMPRYTMQCKA